MKRLMKILSLMLCIVMVVSSLPISALAASNKDVKEEKTETVTVSELKDKRDIYSKTYETSKGTNVIVSSAVPLHYEKDGKLVDIDNTLVKSEKDDSILTNKSNFFNVELPKKMTADSEISLNEEISFKLVNEDVSRSKGTISKKEEIKTDETNSESVAFKESNIDSLSSSIEYKSVLDKTDVEYIVSNNQLKENIIINELPLEDYSISYELNIGKLKADLNKDNSITIFNKKGEPKYTIEKPYMFDSDENETEDIKVSLEQQEGTYLLTYIPSFEWLSKEEIKYPVTLDPTVTIVGKENNTENIEDTYVYNSRLKKNKSYYNASEIIVYNSSNTAWGCLNITNMPYIPSNSKIINASLNLYSYIDLSADYYVGLYRASDNYDINTTPFSSLSWNSGITSYASPIDVEKVSSTSIVNFDITEYVNDIVCGRTQNNTVILKSLDTNSQEIKFASNQYQDSSKYPYITFEYKYENPDGNKHSQDLSLAGIGKIDDFTGSLSFERTEFSLNSDIGDVTFYMGDTVNAPTTEYFGENTSINYYNTISSYNYNSDYDYVITSGDGSKEYIKDGQNGCIIVVDNNTVTVTQENDEQKEERGFTLKGDTYYLTSTKEYSVIDNQNVQEKDVKITYTSFNNQEYRITKINDDVLEVTFEYSSGKLHSLSAHPIDSDNNALLNYINDNANDLEEYYYQYEFGANTLSVSCDDISFSYEKTSTGFIVTDEFGISYEYTLDSLNRVVSVQEISSGDSPTNGDIFTFEYGNGTTTISDGNNTYIEYFDKYGNLKSIIDQKGNAVFAQYDGNNITKMSNSRNSRRNMVDFYGFENDTNEDNLFKNSNGTHSITSNEKLFGNSSLEISAPANNNSMFDGSINNLQSHTTYTLSMWIKADNNINCDIMIDNLSKSTQLQSYQISSSYHSPIFAINNNWQQICCTLTTSDNNFNKFDVSLLIRNNTSSSIPVYIDNVYLQQSSHVTSLNLLTNGEFSTAPTEWNIKKTDDTNTTIENRSGAETDIETIDANDTSTVDGRRFKIEGVYNQNITLSQSISINATTGSKYCYGAWIKANNTIPVNEDANKDISIQVIAYNSNGIDKHTYSTYIEQEYDGWQYIEGEITIGEDEQQSCTYDRLEFVVNFNHQTGTLLVDAATLSVGELYSTEFNYNTNNEISSIVVNGDETELENNDSDSPSIGYDDDNNKIVTYTSSEEYADEITRTIKDSTKYIHSTPLMLQQTDSLFNVTDYLYDLLGNNASVIDSNGREIEYEYDQLQNRIKTVDSFYQLDFDDDEHGDLMVAGMDNYYKYYATVTTDDPDLNELKDNAPLYAEYILNGGIDLESDPYEDFDKTSISVEYTYKGHRLDKIETLSDQSNEPISTYEFEYDKWNNLTKVYINDEVFIQYNYDNANYRQVNSVQYANGQVVNYDYDSDGNVVYEYDSSNQNGLSLAYSYYYYEDGTCYGKKNTINGLSEVYQDGSTTIFDSNNNVIHSYCYDAEGNLIEQLNNNQINVSQPVDISESDNKKDKLVSSINNTNYNVYRTYDKSKRLESEEFYIGTDRNANYPHVLKEYVYNGSDNSSAALSSNSSQQNEINTSNAIRSVRYYLLDAQNNKTYIQCSNHLLLNDNSDFSKTKCSSWPENSGWTYESPQIYYYNAANMLLVSDALYNGKTSKYIYDGGGNISGIDITNKVGNDILQNPTKSYSFLEFLYDEQYSGTGINNCLTTAKYYNVQKTIDPNTNETVSTRTLNRTKSFSYDDMGNTTQIVETDNNNNQNSTEFNWVRGNVLNDMSIGNNDIEFTYDDNNLRTSKEVTQNNNTVRKTEYYWNGNKISGQRMNFVVNNTQKYYDTIVLYDDSGNSYGFVLNEYSNASYSTISNSEIFYYIKDAENTIDAIVDSSGDIVISFDYDDYGVPTVDYDSTTDEYVLLANPLVYRDYIYDQESGLYYLQSRYYDPQICRFISADSVLDNGTGTIMSTNLYAYCENNPINFTDPFGNVYISNKKLRTVLKALLLGIGLNPLSGVAVVCLHVGFNMLKKFIIAKATIIAGKFGSLINVAVGVLSAALALVISGFSAATIAHALIQGKGISITWARTKKGKIYGIEMNYY